MAVQMGTFGSFTTARLAIYASQSSLNVTGNNIANINTKGYTRQRMDLVSLYPSGEARYANNYNLSIGYGVLCDSVSQLRDPFLDIRYRNENASTAAYEAKLNGLKQLNHILDEVGKGDQGFGVIEDQLGDFIEQLQGWNNLTSIEEYDNLVRASADQLCKLFNTAAKDLQEVYANEEKYLEQNVAKANSLLTQIRDLNEQIRAHNIYGDSALELKDARNVAIDELSSLMKIDVTYSMEKIDQFTEVEKLTITLPGTKDPAISKIDAQAQALADNLENLTDQAKADYAAAADDEAKKAILANKANYKAEGFPKTAEDYNYSSNFGKPIKLIDGIYGTQVNLKKIYKENPKYEGQYVTANGGFTDNIEEAEMEADGVTPKKNPNYGKPYLDDLGQPTDDPKYAKNVNPAYGRYLDGHGLPTDDIEKADFDYDEKYLMDIDPLIDKRGFYMRDPQYGIQLKNSIDLKDNDLYGGIQSMRELLTEEGEFASDYELGRNLDQITDPEERKRAELIADENANTKRGIPYYMKALDNLAQQFARELNKLNQPDKYATGLDPDKRPVFGPELTLDQIYQTAKPKEGEISDYSLMFKTDDDGDFVDKDGNKITFTDNQGITRPMTPDDLQYADLDPKVLHSPFDTPAYGNDEATQLANQATSIQNAKDCLALLQQSGGVATQTFVDKEGNPVKNLDGGDMTLDDVKYANLDPLTVHEDFDVPMNAPDGTPLTGNALKDAQLEAQNAAIQKAQENLEILRDADNKTEEWDFYKGGALFSNGGNNNDPTGINAANISVSQDWATGAVRVLNTLQPNEITYDADGKKTVITHSTAGDNITHILSSLKGQRDFYATDIDADSAAKRFYFKGSFQEMFTSISGTLATDTNETIAAYNHYDLETLNLENDRQSISGVDLNEEATNMMQFQKSYSAACQLLTIIDSMLDKLINGTI